MVVLDADFLILLLHPNPPVPVHPKTKQPVPRLKERVEHLIATLEKAREKILIPTPALSEVLVLATDRASDYLAEITSNYGFEMVPFDTMAAVEAAIATSNAKKLGGKKGGSISAWSKIKFDRQIIAIAKVRGVDTIYSNDDDIRKFGASENIKVTPVWDLPNPPAKQADMFEEAQNGQ
jgi:predicted nucleic acid-binding protein